MISFLSSGYWSDEFVISMFLRDLTIRHFFHNEDEPIWHDESVSNLDMLSGSCN